MPVWLSAGLWGLLAASSLILGGGLAFLLKLPRWATAGIISFGCGVLISAVAYDLLENGFQEGGILPIVAGAIAGSVAYALADWLVSRNGAHGRKQSGDGEHQNASEGGGLEIAIGSLLDGIPESIVLGLGLLSGQGISMTILAAIFLSNLPEGLSIALGMKAAGRSSTYFLKFE
jgi:zinc transporter, ZIP family